jgi:hypothetical protein
MRNTISILSCVFIFILFSGCQRNYQEITKEKYYNKFYKVQPKSILVLPPKNYTTAVDAPEHYLASITKPLTEMGYYVFPVSIVDDFFKSENIYNADLARNIPLKKLKEVFGADAILNVDIVKWDTSYNIIASDVDVMFRLSLIDVNTEKEIWSTLAYSLSSSASSNSGIIENLILAAINTSVEYTELAYTANTSVIKNLPYGMHHQKFKKDNNNLLNFIYHHDALSDYMYKPVIKDNKVIIKQYNTSSKLKVVHGIYTSIHSTINNIGYFEFSNFDDLYFDYYGKKRHWLFSYEDEKPFFVMNNSKVFFKVDNENMIKYSKEPIINNFGDDVNKSQFEKNKEEEISGYEYFLEIDRIEN